MRQCTGQVVVSGCFIRPKRDRIAACFFSAGVILILELLQGFLLQLNILAWIFGSSKTDGGSAARMAARQDPIQNKLAITNKRVYGPSRDQGRDAKTKDFELERTIVQHLDRV